MRIEADQEQLLRIAGKLINDKLKEYRDSFGIDDKQDPLAMVAFGILADTLKKDKATSGEDQELSVEVDQLNSLIKSALSSSTK